MPDKLYHSINSVTNQTAFLDFAKGLLSDRQNSENLPTSIDGFKAEWANQSITEFLDAAISWAEDSDFGKRPYQITNPWTIFALFLWAGRSYE